MRFIFRPQTFPSFTVYIHQGFFLLIRSLGVLYASSEPIISSVNTVAESNSLYNSFERCFTNLPIFLRCFICFRLMHNTILLSEIGRVRHRFNENVRKRKIYQDILRIFFITGIQSALYSNNSSVILVRRNINVIFSYFHLMWKENETRANNIRVDLVLMSFTESFYTTVNCIFKKTFTYKRILENLSWIFSNIF